MTTNTYVLTESKLKMLVTWNRGVIPDRAICQKPLKIGDSVLSSQLARSKGRSLDLVFSIHVSTSTARASKSVK